MKRKLSLVIIISCLVFIFSFNLFVAPQFKTAHAILGKNTAAPASAADDLKKLEEQLKALQKQQAQISDSIKSEKNKQSKLLKDADKIASTIAQSQWQIQSIQTQMQLNQVEINILDAQKKQLEEKLLGLQKDIDQKNKDLTEAMNLLYKMSLYNPTFLDKNTKFEDSVISEEKEKTLIKIVKSNIDQIKALHDDIDSKKAQIAQKKQEADDIQSQMKAQATALELQKQGLTWQQQNKLALIESSKAKVDDLADKQQNVSEQADQLEQELNALRNRLLALPPSGTNVFAGQVIGFQGRTGKVCAYVADISKYPASDWVPGICRAPLYFFRDINKYPQMGTHLHFEYRKNGVRVDPYNYLFKPQTYPDFQHKPMDTMILTQGFRSSYNSNHMGNDLVSAYGAPIYAVKPGKLAYFCDTLVPSNPGFGAVVYHTDGTSTLYWHMQKRPGATCTFY